MSVERDEARSLDGSASPAQAPSNISNNVTLHVLSPAPEISGGRITFPSISLDTTVSQLKHRLQNTIPAAPSPDRQRLIYRGRRLLDENARLRDVFQAEVRFTKLFRQRG